MSKKLVTYFSARGVTKGVAELKASVDASTELVEGKLLNGRQTVEALAAWVKELEA